MRADLTSSTAGPDWLATLSAVLDRAGDWTAESVPDSDVPFVDVLWPLVEAAWDLTTARPTVRLDGVAATATMDLKAGLLVTLSRIAGDALATSFAARRDLEAVRERLARAGSEHAPSDAGYRAFCSEMTADRYTDLLSGFPVLGRLLGTAFEQWSATTTLLLARVQADRRFLRDRFAVSAASELSGVSVDAADSHRRGQKVQVLTFSDGERVVYKPRDLRIEAAFQEILQSLFVGVRRPPRVITVAPRDDEYGYCEFVDHRPAATVQELQGHYTNAGRLLAVLYALGANDCHHENLIASGDQLVLIDGETLLEGRLRALDGEQAPGALTARGLATSVMSTGLLPYWRSTPDREAMDPSALGRSAENPGHHMRSGWLHTNTDDMVWTEFPIEEEHPRCSPVPEGQRAPLADYVDHVVAGFTEAYELLTAAAVRCLIAQRIAELAGVRRRVLARSTRVYALIQQGALSARSLTDWFERAMWLDHLARSHVVAVDAELAGRILHAELAAMERGDVPVFEQALGSPDVILDNGDVIADAMEIDGLTWALDRLDALGPADQQRQTTLLAASVAASGYRMTDAPRSESHGRRGAALTSPAAVRAAIIAGATHERDGSMTWLTVNAVGDATRVQLGTAPPGLYDGRAGIACFLTAQGDRDCAAATFAPLLRRCEEADTESGQRRLRHLGPGLLGLGGLLRFAAFGQRLAPDLADWPRVQSRIAASLDAHVVGRETTLNLLSGLGGLVRPLVAIVRAQDEAGSHELGLLRAAADRLADTLDHASGAWPSSIAMAPLTGLSHGASGMAGALAEAFTVTGDPRHLDAALQALDYEATRYDPVKGGWLDLRAAAAARGGGAGVMHSWCHGSIGIALARMNLIRCLPDHALVPRWAAEAETAIEATLAAPPLGVDNLCCGNLGRIAVVLRLAHTLERPEWRRRALTLRSELLRTSGFPQLGFPALPGVCAPGLMTGLAGVGMFLLESDELAWVDDLML